MKKAQLTVLVLLALAGGINRAAAQGTAFTYQGVLTDTGGPLNGFYDLSFTLYDSPSPGGNLVGSPNPNTRANVPISGGLMTNTLDFGSSAFTGGARWLEITIHPHAGGATTTLSSRQPLTPAPYAIYAENAGGVAGGGGIWSLKGSSAYYNGGNVGIGTTTPGAALDVYNAGPASARVYSVNNLNGAVLELREDAANTTYTGAINFNDAATVLRYITENVPFRSTSRFWPLSQVGKLLSLNALCRFMRTDHLSNA